LEELGGWFAMIAGHAGREILRCFDSAESGFNKQSRMESGAPGRPGFPSSVSSRMTKR
jgi:hypothetical protein